MWRDKGKEKKNNPFYAKQNCIELVDLRTKQIKLGDNNSLFKNFSIGFLYNKSPVMYLKHDSIYRSATSIQSIKKISNFNKTR